MSTHLDPLIIKKLQAFARRRRSLIVLRGVCAAIAMLLATMMVVALVDWIFVLDDWIRWTLSGLAYAAVLVAEWRACLRLLVHMPDPRRLARLIEHAEPKLREDLLSAVELGEGDAALDSAQFRQLVQSGVAARLEGVDINRLLPVQLLRRSLIVVSTIVLICAGALTLTSFQFGTSMIRALLPMLNLARVSKVKVQIVEPNPADETVAQGDAVPLLIEIGGQRTNKAVLEIFTKTGGRELVPMSPSAPDQFAASIQVAREDVEYRIRAGDAMTRKYRLRAAARPQVVHFHKTYHYPEYSKLPPKQVTEDNGDLSALEESKVDLELETDQPAREAELRMEQGKSNSLLPLVRLHNGRLGATIAIDRSGIYRVHLVAEATGFENKFSPEYELRANPDLIPQIEIEKPEHDLILPANEIVDISGLATDDLAIDHVEQQFRVNGGQWETLPLQSAGGPKVKVENRWDLMQQGLKAGDTITTKLVAYDLKHNKGESSPLQITLTEAGFEMKRLQALEAQRKLLQSLTALRATTEVLEKRGGEARDQFARLAESDPQRKQAVVVFDESLGEYEREVADAGALLVETLRDTGPGHASADLVMLGRLLSRSGAGAEQNARDNVNLVAADPAAAFTRDLVREAADSSGRAAWRVRLAQESCKTFVAAEEIDVLNENMQVVAREQERIATLAQASGDDAAKWAQLTTRLRVVLTEARSLGELMVTTATHIGGGFEERLRRSQKRIDEQCAAVDNLMAANARGKELLAPVINLSKALTEVRRTMLEIRGNTADASARAIGDMAREVQPSWSSFERLRADTEATLRNDKLPAESRTALATVRWNSKANLFKAHGDFEEARPDADNYFVSDVRMLALALDNLRGTALAAANPSPDWDKAAKQINALDQAFRVLESGHDLSEVAGGLDHLAAAERWEFAALRSRTSNPRDWRWVNQRLHAAPDELGKTQLADQETRKVIQKVQQILSETAGKEARPVDEEMGQRFRADREPVAIPTETQRVAARVREALDLLRKPMEEARKVLAQMAPSLSEMAAQLAKQAEDLKKESAEQAEKVAEKTPEKAQADAKQELAAQQKLTDKVDTFKDALRADAGKQDVLKQEGREHARDVDDALAMLHDPPPRAEQALDDATQQERTAAKQDAFKAAASEQQKLADALSQVSKHFDALEKGQNAQETRTALRQAEDALGVKDQLNQQYANAEKLAELAGLTPEDMLKQLEKALPQNPTMQQELSAIAQNALAAAGAKLADASNRENSVARDVQKLAEQQQKEAQKQQAAAQAAAQAAQAAANNAAQSNPQNPAASGEPGAQNPTAAAPAPPPNAPASAAQPAPPQAAQPPSPELAQGAKQQPVIGHAADEAGGDIQRAGRHEERLQNTATGQQLQQLGQKVQGTAQNQVPQAQKALTAAQMAAQAQAPVNAANTELQTELAQLNQAQNAPAPAAAQPQAGQEGAAPTGEAPQPGQPQSGQPANVPVGRPASPQPGSPAQAQSGQQMAQANANNPAGQPQAAANPAQGAPQSNPSGAQAPAGETAAAPATPDEQTWMARMLDALDAALHATPDAGSQANAQPGQPDGAQPNQPGQPQPGQGQPGQPDPLGQAQQAMNAAAQANAAAMRSARAESEGQKPDGPLATGEASKNGVQANAGKLSHKAIADLKPAKAGDWGKLPKKVAEQLSQGQRESVPAEYRNQIETYYRVIAEKARKE